MKLSKHDSELFVKSILVEKPIPSKRLKKIAKRYRQLVKQVKRKNKK